MIEVFSLIEPLICEVPVSVLNEGLVHGEDVLLAADPLHIGLRGVEGSPVVLGDREGVPSLPDFRVNIIGHLQVLVYSTENLRVQLR
jgi:hypothetical protein